MFQSAVRYSVASPSFDNLYRNSKSSKKKRILIITNELSIPCKVRRDFDKIVASTISPFPLKFYQFEETLCKKIINK